MKPKTAIIGERTILVPLTVEERRVQKAERRCLTSGCPDIDIDDEQAWARLIQDILGFNPFIKTEMDHVRI